MKAEQQKKLVGRLRRVAGQIRAIEGSLNEDAEVVINQLLAVVAASKASLRFYVEGELLKKSELSAHDRQLLARLVDRIG